MSFKSLLDSWTSQEASVITDNDYSVGLSVGDAARSHALADPYPGLEAKHTVTDLISASLDELEAGNGQGT